MGLTEALSNSQQILAHRDHLRYHPLSEHDADLERIYSMPIDQLEIGRIGETLWAPLARANTVAVLGGALGDEGKGRFVDNQIENLLSRPGVESVWVIRYQGGNNAGHTIEKDGLKLALHVIPSFVLHPEAKGVMDKGEIIHPEDLQTEVAYVENHTGKDSLRDRLYLSRDAILCTDLERAEEALTGSGKSSTKRGIGTAASHQTDRSGVRIRDLIKENWREVFAARYEKYEKLFSGFAKDLDGKTLAQIEVPNFRGTKLKEGEATRTVGTKEEFLDRLEKAREWLLQRNMVVNTRELYESIAEDPSVGIVFEGSQAAGLNLQTGTFPDVTSSDTTLNGVDGGTGGFWKALRIADRFAVIKATYTSSVGKRRMPTHVDANPSWGSSKDQRWAAWVQDVAHEKGTTTGRGRDIDFIDLPMLRTNLHSSGADDVVLTHLDIAEYGTPIKICTHYTDKRTGQEVGYDPNLEDLDQLEAHYVELPGWDGNLVRKAKKLDELPPQAKRYIAFLQKRLGFHIVAATTGPDRENLITFPGYNQPQAA